MASTNKTTNYELSQFISTDKPTFLSDYNGDMLKIDTAVKGVDTKAESAKSTAESASASATSAVSAASAAQSDATTAITTANSASTTATNAATTANNAQTTATAADTKVGNLANLTTTDKTDIVSAVNEVNAKVTPASVSVTADGVKTYAELFAELHALIDFTKVNVRTKMETAGNIFHLVVLSGEDMTFFNGGAGSLTGFNIYSVSIKAQSANCHYFAFGTTTAPAVNAADYASNVVENGRTFSIIY